MFDQVPHLLHFSSFLFSLLPLRLFPVRDRGINKFLHLSYFYVTVVGFFITITIGVIISALTGCNGGTQVDSKLLSKYALPVSPSFLSLGGQKTRSADITTSATKEFTNGLNGLKADGNDNLPASIVALSHQPSMRTAANVPPNHHSKHSNGHSAL